MTTTSLGVRTMIAAVAAAAALTVVTGPVAHADDVYGAVSTGPDGKWAMSWGQPNQSMARYQANYNCASNSCQIVLYFTDCAALVQNGGDFHAATGATSEEAELAAHNQNPGSTDVRSACNDGPAGVASYRS